MRTCRNVASRLISCTLLGVGLATLPGLKLEAGTFNSDFNSGFPPGMNPFGVATTVDTGGVGNSGYLRFTEATASSGNSGVIIDDFDGGTTVGGFDVTFDLYIGSGNGADGMSFVFGDFSDSATWAEEGPGTIHGLTIAFDVFNNGGTPAEAPAIDLKWNNVTLFHRLVGATGTTTPAIPINAATTIRTQPTTGGAPVWVPIKIHVDTDGTLDMTYSNNIIFTNLPVFQAFTEPPTNGSAIRFGFGARTGGSFDVHAIDNLNITTVALGANSGQPNLTLVAPQPAGLNAGAAGGVDVLFDDVTHAINPSTVTMRYGANLVTPTVTQADGFTRIIYRGNNGVLPAGRTTNTISYATTSTPAFSNSFSFVFVVDPFATIPTNYTVASVDTTKPGFKYRVHQLDGGTFIRAYATDPNRTLAVERQLANWYIDPTTGVPYPNVADLSALPTDGFFSETQYINWNINGGGADTGFFTSGSTPSRPENPVMGFPGTTSVDTWGAIEMIGYMFLTKGGHRFGFNSDDGFRMSFGPGTDTTSAFFVGNFDGGRGNGTPTLFDVVIDADGWYPIRLIFWNGTGGFNAEFFYVNPATGGNVLVNDPDNLVAPRVYQESPVSRPYISRAIPVQNWIGVAPDQSVVIDITDGARALDAGSVALFINNVPQTIATAKVGKVTTITRASSLANLLPSGLNNVRLVYGYTEGSTPVLLTNNYSYTVAPYYGAIPAGNKVTGASEPGFKVRVAQMDKTRDANQGNGARITGGWDANRMPTPEIQLNNQMINPTNGLPYPNLAQAGANNFVYDVDFINWQYNDAAAAVAQSGWIQSGQPGSPLLGANADVGVPGFPGTGTSFGGLENAVLEITTYLELKAGVTIFGFNSDDGFIAISAPNVQDTLGTLVGFANFGRGNSGLPVTPVGQNPPQITPGVNSGSTLFSVRVPEDGIYPFRILFWQGGTGFNAEFWSMNPTNNTVLLVGDTANGGIPAFKTYNGPARPYVKHSVSPNPWDNAVQQSGPGPITMVGRTRAQITSSDIYNRLDAATPTRAWPNVPIGGVVANGTSEANLRLLVNGALVPATLTTNGTDVTVAWKPNPPLLPGTTNTAGLVYAGTTNYWTFTVQTYTNLSAADARPLTAADPNSRGFRVKVAQTASVTGFTQNSLARAEAQLAGILGPNVAAPGPGPEGTYIYTNIINWTNNNPNNVPQGNFQLNSYGAGTGWPFPFYADEAIPGVPGTGLVNADNSAAEIFAYLEFPAAGMYWFGVNSDDGFAVLSGTPGVTNGVQLGAFNLSGGKGFSDVPFSFIVPQAGLYPIRLVWHNGGGGAGVEYFSYSETGAKIPINDRNNPAAIKAYYAISSVAVPNITSATVSNGNINIVWEGGGTLYSAPTATGNWTSTGDSDGSFSEPTAGVMKFYRVQQ